MAYIVVRDTREKSGHGWFWEPSSNYGGTIVAKLDQGDYSIEGYENFIIIERKGSVAEFANNITQKRFYNELDRSRNIPHVWIVLEFDMDNIIAYPKGSGIPKKHWNKLGFSGPYILKCMIEINLQYPNVNIICAGKHGKLVANSILKRVIEEIAGHDTSLAN